MSNITLTDIEKWISKYPDLWDVYCVVQSLTYKYYPESDSIEFNVLNHLADTFWKLAEIHIKEQTKADAQDEE